MKSDVQIHWATTMKEGIVGNAYGYKVHNQTLRKYVEKYAEITEKAKNALFIMSPEFFTMQFEDKMNWLFTMFEGIDIPKLYSDPIKKADKLIVPSKWVKELFSKVFDANKIFVVPHGVESDFTFVRRQMPNDRPFRFLWVGAPNPRKGWEEITYIWSEIFATTKDFELYVKTTGDNVINKKGNVIFDSRDISRKELVDLYHSAHCFLFPTRGEGFGLTLAEAMATGLPCIATNYSGHTDFFNEYNGWPVGYVIKPTKLVFVKKEMKDIEEETRVAFPHVDEILTHMAWIVQNYKKALEKAAFGSQVIRKNYTWDNSAKTLVNIMREHGAKNG